MVDFFWSSTETRLIKEYSVFIIHSCIANFSELVEYGNPFSFQKFANSCWFKSSIIMGKYSLNNLNIGNCRFCVAVAMEDWLIDLIRSSVDLGSSPQISLSSLYRTGLN